MIIGYFKKDLPNEKGEPVNTIMLHITEPDAFELDLLEKLRNHTDKDIIKDVDNDEEIIIGKPDREEEIVDIPVEKKRRGRPKKAETEPVIETQEETVDTETAEEDQSKDVLETIKKMPSEEVTTIVSRVIEKAKETAKEASDKLPAEEAKIADETIEKKTEPVEKTEEKPIEEKKEPPKKKGFVWKGIQ